MPDNALLLNIGTHIGLAIIRSLGRRNISVYGIAQDPNDIGIYSRYMKRTFILKNEILKDEKLYLKELIGIIREHGINFVMAVSEETCLFLSKNRDILEKNTKLLIPEAQKLDLVLDKFKTYAIAADLNIPIAKMYTMDRIIDEREGPINYPLIIKSRGFIRGRRNFLGYKYKKVNSRKEIIEELNQRDSNDIVIQDYQQGYGVGVEILMKQGEALAAFQHKRLHEIEGGSVLAESVSLDPKLYSYSFSLLRAIGWEGPAMVEWKYVDDENFVLMEINGRFWGSSPLPIACGIDFPYLFYMNFAKDRYLTQKEYSIGVRFCVFWGELRYILKCRKLYLLFDLLRPGIAWNCFSFYDPMPGIMDLILVIGKHIKRIIKL
jgi:predicted ATP-grasp superfamily ATP-dependent carboligase